MSLTGPRLLPLVATLLLAGPFLGAQDSPDQQSARSVVHIFATQKGGESLGTGFSWPDSNHIVTALHVVAGSSRIDVRSEFPRRATSAVIERANLAADLALLRLTESLGLKPLTVAPARLAEEHFIWGYPLDVFSMQGDDIRFSRSLEQAPTLLSIFQTEDRFKQAVGDQGYPSARAQILRVSSIITHGFSGAPIFNQAGQVVGIGDGGLNQGIARVNWAIPAATYLRLESFTDRPPQQAAAAASLMSATRPKPPAIANQPDNSTLRWSWSAELGEIIDSLPEKDPNDLDQDDILEALEGLPNEIFDISIDVYEDAETGATIAVPSGVELTYDSAKGLLLAEDGGVLMLLQITQGEARRARAAFEGAVNSTAKWQADPDNPDESYSSSEGSYSNRYRRVMNARNPRELDAEMEMTLVVSGEDFLGSAIVLEPDDEPTDADLELFQLLAACVKLADFGTR